MTDVSRRSVLGIGAAGLAASALGIVGPIAGAPGAQAADPSYTSAASLYLRPRFASLRGKGFSLVRSGVGVPVVLRQVADLAGAPAGATDQFRLTFSTRGAVPEQGTYSLRRAGFTPTSLFVVPGADGTTLTAVINSAG
ncbi:DUF6916 family protein [Nocardioides antri]|uniref:DUF6916 domain-containing protein n=1 Tax=Nocardioides antri TaxID=2607659 RepID=A0A5B1M237_9ACTN|nr:hypothetical protein [Nocardioides antri]KAA1426179.1 hypothetical protein F0U47_14825 [Nocardioides antri]